MSQTHTATVQESLTPVLTTVAALRALRKFKPSSVGFVIVGVLYDVYLVLGSLNYVITLRYPENFDLA